MSNDNNPIKAIREAENAAEARREVRRGVGQPGEYRQGQVYAGEAP